MKKILICLLLAICMVVGLASCGMSVKSLEKKLEKLEDEEDFEYDDLGKSDIKLYKSIIKEEVDLEGGIEAIYEVVNEDGEEAMIIFFEKSADAKAFGDEAEDLFEDLVDKFEYKVSGKAVVFGEKSVVKAIVE